MDMNKNFPKDISIENTIQKLYLLIQDQFEKMVILPFSLSFFCFIIIVGQQKAKNIGKLLFMHAGSLFLTFIEHETMK